MTSREASLSLYKQVDKCGNTGEFNLNEAWDCYKIIDKDLDRLERLEKAFKIICEELDINVVNIEGDYELVATWSSSDISKRKGKLLKEILGSGAKYV